MSYKQQAPLEKGERGRKRRDLGWGRKGGREVVSIKCLP